MSDLPQKEPAPVTAPRAPGRQVALPRASKQRGKGLILVGVALVGTAALGFWFVLDSIDDRRPYLMAARDIERWELVGPDDFVTVEANVGQASAMAPADLELLLGKWAASRIPSDTIVTAGMFENPPISGDDAGRVLIEVTLPHEEAPFDTLESGDKVALFGREPPDEHFGEPPIGRVPISLIGVLTVGDVLNGSLYYIVPPERALEIHSVIDRYAQAADRRIWKLGVDLEAEDLTDALNELAGAGL